MAVDTTNVIDFVVYGQPESGPVILCLIDHLPWGDLEGAHLELLQAKLNCYVGFIESGQLVREFPQAEGREVVVKIIANYPVSQQGQNLLDWCTLTIRELGFDLIFERAPTN
jgi:hypothetical protein